MICVVGSFVIAVIETATLFSGCRLHFSEPAGGWGLARSKHSTN
jgi:hypothetical protein